MEKEKITPTKVELSHGFYFLITPYSFDLYENRSDLKTPKIIGYYTILENLINKVTHLIVGKNGGVLSSKEFQKKWNEIQQELTEYTSKYQF